MGIAARLGQAAGHQKQAGPITESLSGLNPLNILGGPVGALAALSTPTRGRRQQAEANQDLWKNLLIPGYGGYNAMKRIGHGAWGPEQEEERRKLEREQLDAERKDLDDEEIAGRGEKAAGVGSELAGGLNPLNWYGLGPAIGAGVAGLTPTRTARQQAVGNQDFWKNLLIPGYSTYSGLKRVGHTAWSPEMQQEERQMKREQLDEEDAASKPTEDKPDEPDEAKKAAGDLFSRLGRAAGALAVA